MVTNPQVKRPVFRASGARVRRGGQEHVWGQDDDYGNLPGDFEVSKSRTNGTTLLDSVGVELIGEV